MTRKDKKKLRERWIKKLEGFGYSDGEITPEVVSFWVSHIALEIDRRVRARDRFWEREIDNYVGGYRYKVERLSAKLRRGGTVTGRIDNSKHISQTPKPAPGGQDEG